MLKKILILIILTFSLSCSGIFFINITNAADGPTLTILPDKDDPLGKKIQEGSMTLADIPVYITHATQFFITIAGTISVLFVMIGGYQYLTAFGETDKTGKAKTTIFMALVGLVITLLAWVIVNVVMATITTPSA